MKVTLSDISKCKDIRHEKETQTVGITTENSNTL